MDIYYEVLEPIKGEKEATFKEIIQNRFSLNYYEKFLVKKCCEENIEFYNLVQEFKSIVREKKLEKNETTYLDEIYEKAKHIYTQYIKENSKKELNLEHEMKESFKNIFESDKKDFVLNVRLFDKIEKRIYNLMESTFSKFLKSTEYKQLVDQLKWIDQFKSLNVSTLEPLSRLVDILTEKDIAILEDLIEKKKKGILSFKRDKIYCKAIKNSEEPKILPFVAGDILTVLEINQKNETWLCEFHDHIGHVPSSIITTKIIENREILKKYQKKEILTSYDLKKPSNSSIKIPESPIEPKKDDRETHWVSFKESNESKPNFDKQLLEIHVSMVEEEEGKISPIHITKEYKSSSLDKLQSSPKGSFSKLPLSPRSSSDTLLLETPDFDPFQISTKNQIKSKKTMNSPRVVPFQSRKIEEKK